MTVFRSEGENLNMRISSRCGISPFTSSRGKNFSANLPDRANLEILLPGTHFALFFFIVVTQRRAGKTSTFNRSADVEK
jgi:hypothetical protein